MANRRFTQFYGSLHKKPVQLDCNFVVDSTNVNALGQSSLKGPGIANVFMHTTASFTGNTHSNTVIDSISSTANLVVGMAISGSGLSAGTRIASITSATAITISIASGSTLVGTTLSYVGVGNPNPASGLIFVNFQDNYNRYYFGSSNFMSPASGTNINISSSLVVGNAYVITAVGTSTTANWVAVGVPIGITPAVGVAFIASATSGSGTGVVQVALNSSIMAVEVVGNPNVTLTSNAATVLGVSSGSYMILQCLSAGSIAFTGDTHSSTTIDGIASTVGLVVGHAISGTGIPLGATIASIVSATAITISAAATATASGVAMSSDGEVLKAPVNGSILSLSFFLSNSSILVQGE